MVQPYLPVLSLIAKYPFLKVAGSFLKREYGELDNIFSSEKKIDVEARELGKKIVKDILEGRDITNTNLTEMPGIGFLCSTCDAQCIDCEVVRTKNFAMCNFCGKCFENCVHEVNSVTYKKYLTLARKSAVAYLSSRLLVSQMEAWARRKYAVKEAGRYIRLLNAEDDWVVVDFVASDLGVMFRRNERKVEVRLPSYLKCATRLKADKWRLVNRKLSGGWVELDRREFIRLLKEKLREKLEEPIIHSKIQKEEDIVANVDVSKAIEPEELGKADLSCFPPCMKKILADLKGGVNVPHTARFALTAFLLNIGMDVEEIISLFSGAPDFDPDKTRYQVEHIAGRRGKGTEYVCPSCETMRTYHNCYGECGVSHPLVFYKIEINKKKRMKANENFGRKTKGKGKRKRRRDKTSSGNT